MKGDSTHKPSKHLKATSTTQVTAQSAYEQLCFCADVVTRLWNTYQM
jgi:hypothetical protein